ncbi:MAG TPA: Trk family potassium uptake protein [Clostridium sp.]|nr:Trk family potassium uptake protein [Clostridium sp.]
MKDILKKRQFTPMQILAIGYAVIIFLGAMLLALPISTNARVYTPFLDCIFTSTSAVCVTGLITVDTGTHWSYFGKTVIMMLIQIGGLGFMSFATMLSLIIGKRITLKERLVMQEAMNSTSLQGIVKLAKYILIFTFSIEGLGALLLSTQFIPEFGFSKGIFYSIFHSVSAFCNAGFDLMGNFNSLINYNGNVVIISTISALIVTGGLGFYVWNEIYNYKNIKKLSLHSKLVISMTIALIIGGAILFFLFEFSNEATMKGMSFKDRILASIFASVSPRTAGFNSISLADMTIPSIFLSIILMFIGGSPGSTAGGLKTTTAGILYMTVKSVIKGREDTEIFKKKVSKDTVYKAFSVMIIALGLVITVTVLLSITEHQTGVPFEYYIFEATSAFGTVGSTLGLTQKLSAIGKIIVALTMYAGRLGPLTLVLAISINRRKKALAIKYPEDKILVG